MFTGSNRINFNTRILLAFLLLGGRASSQSVETYAGQKRAGVDVLWFKNFASRHKNRSPWLFFSRTRASVDYHHTPTAFGTTNAVSYNFKSGLGIVAVSTLLNTGLIGKAGIQYYHGNKDFLFFGWLVADLKKHGNIHLFGLFRYQPAFQKSNPNWKLFTQLELFPVFSPHNKNWNLTQRVRVGVKYQSWAAGWMSDFNQTGRVTFQTTNNLGGFLRYDF